MTLIPAIKVKGKVTSGYVGQIHPEVLQKWINSQLPRSLWIGAEEVFDPIIREKFYGCVSNVEEGFLIGGHFLSRHEAFLVLPEEKQAKICKLGRAYLDSTDYEILG